MSLLLIGFRTVDEEGLVRSKDKEIVIGHTDGTTLLGIFLTKIGSVSERGKKHLERIYLSLGKEQDRLMCSTSSVIDANAAGQGCSSTWKYCYVSGIECLLH